MMEFMRPADLTAELRARFKALWLQCFPEDDGEYVDFFLENCPEEAILPVLTEDGALVADGYMFPMELHDGSPIYYGYAGGVDPAYRGGGHWRVFVDSVVAYAKERNALLYNYNHPNLRSFNRKHGMGALYVGAAYHYERGQGKYSGVALGEVENMEPLSAAALYEKREAYLSGLGVPYVRFPLWYLEFLQIEKAFTGSLFHLLTVREGTFYFVGRFDEDTLVIEETDMKPHLLPKYAEELCKLYDIKKVLAAYPVSAEQVLPCGDPSENFLERWECYSENKDSLLYEGQGTGGPMGLWLPFSLL